VENEKTLPELQAEHKPPPRHEAGEQPAFRNYVRDLILGFNDGVVSVYAITAGVAGAAGALSMGIGEYVSTKAQAQYYAAEARRERAHIRAYRDLEMEEVREILREKEYPEPLVEPLVQHVAASEDRFVEFMMREEFGVGKEAHRSPVSAMLLIMVAFVAGAALPVLPFVLAPDAGPMWAASVLSLGGLFTAGAFKGRASGLSWVRSGGEMAVLGALAAAVTYGVGVLFGIAV
jgi:vacuolar iron transporter family protein